MLRVSVVICAHDDARYASLVAAVGSVIAQEPAPAEVIVVIDHNRALHGRVQDALPDVTVLENVGPRGLSGARNTGLNAASGEIIAFIDDDAAARPGWIAGLVAGYDSPSVLGVGGTIIPNWEGSQPAWFPDEFLWVVGCTYRGYPTNRAQVRNSIGCNMSFRRTVFETVGGFHQGVGRGRGLPLGCEETELCLRAAREIPGGVFVHEPSATVDHIAPASRGRISYFLKRCYSEGISKAYVTRLAGAGRGLSTERRYLTHTLSRAVVTNTAGLLRGHLAGPARAGAVIIGLAAFAAGYGWGLLRFRQGTAPAGTIPAEQPEA